MMHRARSPFFRGGVILPALAMAAQGAAGARRRPSSAPADRKYRTERHGAADDRLTSIIVALGTCSELHPRLEVLGPLRGSSRERTLQGFSAVIRVRLATLGSLGKWAVRRDKIARNPVDVLTRPRRKARLPRMPRWEEAPRLEDHEGHRHTRGRTRDSSARVPSFLWRGTAPAQWGESPRSAGAPPAR